MKYEVEYKLNDYQRDTIHRVITQELDEYFDKDPWTTWCDMVDVMNLIEVLYKLGYKKEAKTYNKDIKKHVRNSDIDRDDIRTFLDEFKKIELGENKVA